MSAKHKQLLLNVFTFICNFMEENKYTPSYEEISKSMKISVPYISRLVSELVEIGLLSRPRKKALKLGELDVNEWLRDM